MKEIKTIAVVLGCALLISCTNATVTGKPKMTEAGKAADGDNDKKAMQYLFKALKRTTSDHNKFTGNEILLGDTSITVKVEVEQEGEKEGQQIVAAKFTTLIKTPAEHSIVLGSVGVDTSREAAMETCITEWGGMFVISLAHALNNKWTSLAGMQVHPGLMGIRGDFPESAFDSTHGTIDERVVKQIKPLLKGVKNELIAVQILLVVDEKGKVQGQCRLNNEESPALLEKMMQLQWPAGTGGYMYKQFYLIRSAAM